MAIDRAFEPALLKAMRSLEVGGHSSLWESPDWASVDWDAADDAAAGDAAAGDASPWIEATDERLWALLAALRRDVTPLTIARRTGIDPWFTERLARIVAMERRLLAEELTPSLLRAAKRLGFGDPQVAELSDSLPERVRAAREEWGILPVYKVVDTCAAEFDAQTPVLLQQLRAGRTTRHRTGGRACS